MCLETLKKDKRKLLRHLVMSGWAHINTLASNSRPTLILSKNVRHAGSLNLNNKRGGDITG